jgi:hypothetical protein
MRVLAPLSALHSAISSCPPQTRREIRLRRITEPDAEQKSLLRQLGLACRVDLNSIEHVL